MSRARKEKISHQMVFATCHETFQMWVLSVISVPDVLDPHDVTSLMRYGFRQEVLTHFHWYSHESNDCPLCLSTVYTTIGPLLGSLKQIL
jgi:hypothetical protein